MSEEIQKPKQILHLNVKSKWFDMIACGEKTEEYRELKLYWTKKFTSFNWFLGCHGIKESPSYKFGIDIKGTIYNPKDVIICFSNGYSKNRRQIFVECEGVELRDKGKCREDWGAEPEKNITYCC